MKISEDRTFIWLLTGKLGKLQIYIINIDRWSTNLVYEDKNDIGSIAVLDDHFILLRKD